MMRMVLPVCAAVLALAACGSAVASEAEETAFRAAIEARKDRLLESRTVSARPVMLSPESIERARRNIASTAWAKKWFDERREVADFVVSQPEGYADLLISETTPGNTYGFTCPNCVGRESQEGEGISLVKWDYHEPDVIACRKCGQRYPDPKYPETGTLDCMRSGQVLTYYVNDAERNHGVSGDCQYAWRWVGFAIHPSFAGVIRQKKSAFAVTALGALADTYAITGDPRYAGAGIPILKRLAHCYRGWLYHDYWDTVADCDPIYAAWHASELPQAWKLHPCDSAFKNDTPEKASMLQPSYWGAGRIVTSTDGATLLCTICEAFDLFRTARNADGSPLMTDADRTLIERDLILEWIIGAEPFVGGEAKADNHSNKAPRVYLAMAAVGKCLGMPNYVDVALRGYEGVRDESFLYDGFSRESPSYTAMYLGPLLQLTEMLQGYRWPAAIPDRSGVLDIYSSDSRLRLMLLAQLHQLTPAGRYMPVSDTNTGSGPSPHFIEVGLRRYPDQFIGAFRALFPDGEPSAYAVYELDPNEIERKRPLDLPEILFPAWMTAILRNGNGPDGSLASLVFNPTGGHRHMDNLSLYYIDRGNVMLDDLGYVGDMPVNGWIHDTPSHNLVIVDGKSQEHAERAPRLRMMATSPRASMVEVSSNAYPQCTDYRRWITLVKEPEGRTFLVDIFRVEGGSKHEYRVSSPLASSDKVDGSLTFDGLEMPPEAPLRSVGQSLAREDIYGLRNIRSSVPPAVWSATWSGSGRSCRLWMASAADRVEAADGPGQTSRSDAGRRLRYLNVVHEGENLKSTFAAVYEPRQDGDANRIASVERLATPASAGPDAIAVRVIADSGTYTVLGDFADEAVVDGIRFRGRFGIVFRGRRKAGWTFAVGTSAMRVDSEGFGPRTAVWNGVCAVVNDGTLQTATPCPGGWPTTPAGCTVYVTTRAGGYWTGFPVKGAAHDRIEVERFPVPADASEFELPSIYFSE